jgi:hypothetical protein
MTGATVQEELPMQIRLQVSLTVDDYLESQQELRRQERLSLYGKQPPKPAFRKPTWVLVGVLAAILYFGLGITAALQGNGTGVFSVRAILTILCGIVAIALYALRRKIWNRILQWSVKDGLPKQLDVTLGDASMEIRTETTTTSMTWNHFVKVSETEHLFLLMNETKGCHLLPKRAFGTAQELDEFRRFAQARVGREVNGFPVLQP